MLPDQRAQSYTIAVQTSFASLEDMKYYESECKAHKEFVKVVGPRMQGIMTVVFEAVVEV